MSYVLRNILRLLSSPGTAEVEITGLLAGFFLFSSSDEQIVTSLSQKWSPSSSICPTCSLYRWEHRGAARLSARLESRSRVLGVLLKLGTTTQPSLRAVWENCFDLHTGKHGSGNLQAQVFVSVTSETFENVQAKLSCFHFNKEAFPFSFWWVW